jgi:hypothetical protein
MLEEKSFCCPHCGENITVLVDCSQEDQCYVEDCQVCCSPIVLIISVTNGSVARLEARREND